MSSSRTAVFALAALTLGACVSQGPFPSLAPRPAESEDWSEEPARAAPAVADDPALRERIAALLGEARAGAREFEAEAPAAERAASRAGSVGSDSWLEAQQAISRLQAASGRTGAALADLHDLSLSRASTPTSDGDRASLDAAIAETEVIASRQQERVGRISR